MSCPVCGGASWSLHLDKGEHRYVACDSCTVLRLDPFPEPDEAAALYGDDYFTAAANAGYDDYVADAAVHRRNGRARIARLGDVPAEHRGLVDVGCAHGYSLLEARAAGWEPAGVDANASARRAVEAEGMRCAATFGELDVPPGTLGAVTFFQVLEHLPDPVAALREAHDALAPDGRVLIETWDRGAAVARLSGRRWQVATPPSVLWLWDRAGLARVLDAARFEMTSFRRSMKWVTLGLVAGQVRDRGTDSWWVRGAERLRGLPLPYALGDLVTVSARPR